MDCSRPALCCDAAAAADDEDADADVVVVDDGDDAADDEPVDGEGQDAIVRDAVVAANARDCAD